MLGEEWTQDAEKVGSYLSLADESPIASRAVLLKHVSLGVRRISDLGTGDGRLLAMLRADRSELAATGLDFSALMLERVELIEHDLSQPLPTWAASTRWFPPLPSTTSSASARSTPRSSSCSSRAGSSSTSSTSLRRPSACTKPSSPRSTYRSRTPIPGDGVADRRQAGNNRCKRRRSPCSVLKRTSCGSSISCGPLTCYAACSCSFGPPVEEFLDTAQVARELGVTANRVRQLIQKKQLPAERFSGRYMISSTDLKAFENLPPGRPHHPRQARDRARSPKGSSGQ